MRDKASLSSFLNGTVGELQVNKTIVLIYLAIMIPVGAVSAYFDPSETGNFFNIGLMVDQSLLSKGAFAVIATIGSFVVGLVAYYWLIAAMVRQTTSPGFDRILPFIGIMILSYIGIAFGFILLIAPGIYLAVRWVATLPCVIAREDNAMDSFGESNQMTQGYGWSIFGTGLLLFVIFWVFSMVVAGLGVLAAGLGAIAVAILASVLQNISSVLFAGFTITVYRQLGNNQEELADVFE